MRSRRPVGAVPLAESTEGLRNGQRAAGAPSLTVLTGAMRGRGCACRLGNAGDRARPEATSSSTTPHLSRRHAAIRLTAQEAFLDDLGSTNGTWLQRPTGRRRDPARRRRRIRLGRVELRFFDPGAADTEPVNDFRNLPLLSRTLRHRAPARAAEAASAGAHSRAGRRRRRVGHRADRRTGAGRRPLSAGSATPPAACRRHPARGCRRHPPAPAGTAPPASAGAFGCCRNGGFAGVPSEMTVLS